MPTQTMPHFGSAFQELGSKLQDRYKNALVELHQATEAVARQREALELEKALMLADGVDDDDIVELNVSGEVMASRRRTLCQVEGSLMAGMFSGRWDDRLARDRKGRIFLEFNPMCFRALLSALQHDMRHPGSDSWSKLEVGKEHMRDLRDMMDHLGLPLRLTPQLRPVPAATAMLTLESERRVRHNAIAGHAAVLSAEPLPASKCSWELRVEHNIWVYVGVLGRLPGEPEQPQDKHSHQDYGGYGWGCLQQAYVAGATTAPDGWEGFCSGDVVTMTLDVRGRRLSMAVQRGDHALAVQSMALPADAAARSWYIHLNLVDPNSCVELLYR